MTSLREPHSGDQATGTVAAPGARLYYQLRGSGPVLMMLCGGPAGADGYATLTGYLAADYTVVTYDRRGLSRSPLDNPDSDPDITIATHSDDVHAILAALGAAPALVFGSSIGALIGLDLLTRHPHDVRLLIAHEPPVRALAAGEEKNPAGPADSYAQTGDADAVIRQFAASLTPEHLMPLAPKPPVTAARTSNNQFFLAHDGPAVQRYELDLAALHAHTSRLVIAGGRDGHDFSPYQSASALAGKLGTTLHEFPGHHAGYAIYPAEFAQTMRQVLR
jgi:pimeloyl-ACP methyl ester carboxylesterase